MKAKHGYVQTTPRGGKPDPARPRPLARARRMNATERAYAARLAILQRSGEIRSWHFEAVKFRIADDCFYTPDFLVVMDGWIELHEVKGFWREDARVKWKAVAEMWPIFRFVAAQKGKGPDSWKLEVYGE